MFSMLTCIERGIACDVGSLGLIQGRGAVIFVEGRRDDNGVPPDLPHKDGSG